jgi:diguanylate cyclase (GGDEF)-like protein
MIKEQRVLEILILGVDSFSLEAIKAGLKDLSINYHLTILQNCEEVDQGLRPKPQVIFFYSNKQGSKTIQDLHIINRKYPGSAVTLISPKTDISEVISTFRSGLFDYLTTPIDGQEIRTVLYRIKMHEAIQSGRWNPERAVLHLFSKPENFSSLEEISAALKHYIQMFMNFSNMIQFNHKMEMITYIEKNYKFKKGQIKRINKFLLDETGLLFGLRLKKNEFEFLIKNDESGSLSLIIAKPNSNYPMSEILNDYLTNILKTCLTILKDSKSTAKIRLLSVTDEITGLYNQRKLVEDLDYYISRYPYDQVVFSLLFIDIDYFKNVNDQYGHVVGSQLLIDMAKVLKTQLRSTDLVYRYGGDEFIVLLPRANIQESKKIALRISESVKEAEFNLDNGEKYKLSLSVGIAEFPTDASDAKAVIDFADKMMYLSKKSGRGKVFHINEVVA